MKILNGTKSRNKGKYCNKKCSSSSRRNKLTLNCSECNLQIFRLPSEVKKSKTNRYFCNHICSATYNNKNKTHGIRVSSFELYCQSKLITDFDLKFVFNDKKKIGTELDIHIPSINLAIELNGIFHFKPIFGDLKLTQIQNNDKEKINKCKDAQITLHVLDISKYQQSTKHAKSDVYNQVKQTIINHLATCDTCVSS